jgi:hypothetical protein
VDDDALPVLRRWEESGGTWRVVVRTPTRLVLDLLTCDAGEVMSRIEADPAGDALRAHVGDRSAGPE